MKVLYVITYVVLIIALATIIRLLRKYIKLARKYALKEQELKEKVDYYIKLLKEKE